MNPLTHSSTPSPEALSRRRFLRNSSLAVAGSMAAANFPSVLGQEKPAIKAVVIGLGGRGSGAAQDFLDAAKIAEVDGKIVAVADIFPDKAANGTQKPFNVAADKCFSGFDAYMKAIHEPGVNYVIIATPPGFKASQVKAAIEAGKNVFTEKPVATDGPGCRVMYAAGDLAKQKGLKVAAGT